jgi:hypothetical protein
MKDLAKAAVVIGLVIVGLRIFGLVHIHRSQIPAAFAGSAGQNSVSRDRSAERATPNRR